MANNPSTVPGYNGQTAAPDANYTYGSARDDAAPGDLTGTPRIAAEINDIIGFQQALLNEAGIVPSGSPDTVLVSQYMNALRKALANAVVDYVALRALKSAQLVDGAAILVGGVSTGGLFVVKTGTVTDNEGSLIVFTDDVNRYAERAISAKGDVHSKWFGSIGDGAADDSVALQTSLDANSQVNLAKSHKVTTGLVLNDWQTIKGDNESQVQLQPGNTIIGILAQSKLKPHLANFRIDGANGGQLDAGLIQLNGCTDFLVEDVILENGGTIGAASPQGVNGFSFATNAFPGGDKCSGKISRVVTRNFTKAPVNWTTLAEGGVLSDSEFYDSVGNGQTPAIQVNGGRKFKVNNCLVDGTEGAAVAIGSVGTVPPLAAQDVEVSFNTYRRIGELGQVNSEQFVYLISDGQGAGDLQNVNISNEIIEGCAGGVLKTAGGVKKVSLHSISSRNTQGAYDLQGCEDITLTGLKIESFNSLNNASQSVFSVRGSTNTLIDGAEINSELQDTTGFVVSCTATTNNVTIKNVNYHGGLTLTETNIADFLTNGLIHATTKVTAPASTNHTLQLLKVPDGRTIEIDIEVNTAKDTIYATQRIKASADAAAGTATIQQQDLLFDSKAGIATGLFADITGGNVLRVRFLNSSVENLDLDLNITLTIT